MEFLNPEQILNQLGLREDMTVADFGCGAGGWVLPLAKKLKFGRVYAIDIQDDPLNALKVKQEALGLRNIKIIKADLENELGSLVQSGLLDMVIMSNLLFQVGNREKVLNEAKRVLRQGGKLLVIDWKLEAFTGPAEGRVGPKEAKEMAEKIGLVVEKEVFAGEYHYGLILVKQ